ncbi:RagB/SusD family nutrient uptake outer membrane protein [Hymenobacter sp. BT491]|uniref:RagB/SusD family nutrient uptake outer membrane protein n=1 Tax=Hymenobacter sp. BT491 TaxID=2766779 RepID=UPI001653BD9B|nr:RagB/SusD family nutrient uptake outer membrane protein [Hymenobacter sp. BT491]MBC6989047.1 RagB/SusD family nutrient uptake outer membrane protein [Hymenobacter sp. BT491]
MKRIIISFLGLLTVAQLLSSCKDTFLDENPKSLYTPQTSLVDSLGFEAGMAGLMSVVREQYTYDARQGLLGTMQLGTDVCIPGSPEGVEVPYYNYNLLNSQDAAASIWWSWAYRTINNANVIIQQASVAPATVRQGYKNRITAEAKFYRAYAYNFLATLYGDVPLIDQPATGPRNDYTRTPLAEVNTFIINDLTSSIPNLSLVTNPRLASGRIHRAVAQQLLAEVYLRTGQNNLAEQQCQAIISSGLFKLITARYGVRSGQPGDYYSDMFVVGNQRRSQGNTELIWGIEQQLNIPGGTTSAQQRRMWIPGYYGISGMLVADSLGGRGIGRMRLSNWVDYRLFAANDIRNSKYNLRRRFYYNDPKSANYGKRVIATGSDTLFRITPYITKWAMYDPADEFGYGTIKDIPMMRLGETYLLLAEAQFKQGNLAGAAASINVLRTRAKADQVTAGDITLNFILDERTRELIGEEQRRLTLVRTGTLVERTNRLNGASVSGLTQKNVLLPIPQTERDLNNGALSQNPGY